MAHRYITDSLSEAEAAVALLRGQGFQAEAQTIAGRPTLTVNRGSVQVAELMLRRAPSVRRDG